MTSESADHNPHLWHDDLIRALRIDASDQEQDGWKSDLVLHIGHIVGGKRTPDDQVQFLLAPAILSFHDTCDLYVAIDCGDTGGQVALHDLSIDQIVREPMERQKVCFGRAYYRWRIELNWPKGGVISFTASGYSQVLQAESAVPQPVGLFDKSRSGSVGA